MPRHGLACAEEDPATIDDTVEENEHRSGLPPCRARCETRWEGRNHTAIITDFFTLVVRGVGTTKVAIRH